jgi:hypothetical protein
LKFKLIYVGELKINPKKRSQHLHDIRMAIHPQLKRLTEISPYDTIKKKLFDSRKGVREIGGARFFPIISPELNLLAELDVQILHPELLETPHADIDNRMKTLLDALKRPQSVHEVAQGTPKNEVIYTLLDDDHLVTKMTINTSHLLYREPHDGRRRKGQEDFELMAIITVNLRASKGTMDNLAVIV